MFNHQYSSNTTPTYDKTSHKDDDNDMVVHSNCSGGAGAQIEVGPSPSVEIPSGGTVVPLPAHTPATDFPRQEVWCVTPRHLAAQAWNGIRKKERANEFTCDACFNVSEIVIAVDKAIADAGATAF